MSEIGSKLNVNGEDLKEIVRQRRRDALTKAAQVLTVVTGAILGVLVADAAVPYRPTSSWDGSYPFVPLMLASSTRSHFHPRPWKGPIFLSMALFAVAFLFVAGINTIHNSNFGFQPKYGVFSSSATSR